MTGYLICLCKTASVKIRKSQLAAMKKQILVVFVAHLISFLVAVPILHFELKVPESEIDTLADSLYYVFVSVSTIGYGKLYAFHPISKLLVVAAFVLTRMSFMLAVISVAGGAFGGRQRYELSVDERLVVIENELKQMRGVIYNVDKMLCSEVKHIKSVERKLNL